MRIPTPIDQLASSYVQIDGPKINQNNDWVKYAVIGVIALVAIAVTYRVIRHSEEKER